MCTHNTQTTKNNPKIPNNPCVDSPSAAAFAAEAILWPRLSEVVDPRRDVWVRVGLHIFVDVRLRREVGRIAADVLRVRVLVNANPVDAQLGGEGECWVDESESLGDTQVDYEIL